MVHQLSTSYPTFDYVLITNEGELESFQDVKTRRNKHKWMKAMQEEIYSLIKNDTYELV